MYKKIISLGVFFSVVTTVLIADSNGHTLQSVTRSVVSSQETSKPFVIVNEESPAVKILFGMTTSEIFSQVVEYVRGLRSLGDLEINMDNHSQFLAATKIVDLTISPENQQNSTFQVRYLALQKSDAVMGTPHFNTIINAFSTPPADEQDPLWINGLDHKNPDLMKVDPKLITEYRAKLYLYVQKDIILHPELTTTIKKVAEVFAHNIGNLQSMLSPAKVVIYSGTSGTGKSTIMKKNLPDLDLEHYISSTDNIVKMLSTELNGNFSNAQLLFLGFSLRRELDEALKEKYKQLSLIQELWLVNEYEIANIFKNPLPIEINDFDGDLRLISLRTIMRARTPGGRPTFPWDQMTKSYKQTRECRPKIFASMQKKDSYQLHYSFNDGSQKIFSLEDAQSLTQMQLSVPIDEEIAAVGESLITKDDVAQFGEAIKEFEGMKISEAFELAQFPISLAQKDKSSAQRFTILFTGDTHSHLENTQKIAHRILSEKQNPANGEVIVADVGDMMTGTEYFEISKGALEIEVMNLAGYSISTIGNHEFDAAFAHLQEILEGANFDIVCANVYDSEKKSLVAEPYKILPVGALNVAFVGIMGKSAWDSIRPTAKQGLNLLDPDDVLDELLPQLEKAADVIILLSHSGIANDRQFAEKHIQLDAILGGHSHTYMSEPELIQVLGDNKRIPVFHAFKNGEFLGKLTFDVVNKEKKHSAQMIKMDSSQEPKGNLSFEEEQIKNKLFSVSQKIEEIYSIVIAECVVPMSKEPIKKGVGPLGRDFICHILKDTTKADIVFYPTNGIKGGLEKGPLTLGTIFKLIHSDRLVTYNVRGAWVRQMMDEGEKRWPSQSRTFQTNGIEIHPATHNLTVNGKPLLDEVVYRVSGPSFFFERELMDSNGKMYEKYTDMVDSNFEEYPEETRTLIIEWLKVNELPPYIQRQALLDNAA